MANKEIIICIDNHRVYFNPDLSIAIQDTNIPKEHLTFRSNEKILWKVEMVEYSGSEKCLKVRVLEYQSGNIDVFGKQQPKKAIERLLFEKFDWPNLEPLLSSYQKIHLHHVLSNIDADLFSTGEVWPDKGQKLEPFSIPADLPVSDIKAKTENITTQFLIDISDIQFKLGYVAFIKKIEQINDKVEFRIINEHILAEFDNVKYWFAKILKTRKIKVNAGITIRNKVVIGTTATSAHIDKITPALIDSVKYQRTHALIKAPKIDMPDKSLFTAEEIFSQFESDDIEGNAFRQTDIDILSFLSEKSNIRNKHQLTYLAGGKQTERQKLRYTLYPHFGFVFLIEGEKNNHFVWELLNSHATYIWSLGKSDQDIELQYKRIEAIIGAVRSSGREEYKRAYRNNHQDHDLAFRAIEHDQANSHLKDGFLKWKNKLNEMLV